MTSWTLAAIKARHLALEGYCQTEGCKHFFTFDLDRLIAAAGPDYVVPDFIPDMTCTQCDGPLKVFLAAIPPEDDQEPATE